MHLMTGVAASTPKPIKQKYKTNMSDFIENNANDDGIDRRGFLKCMAWAGTGVIWQGHSVPVAYTGLSAQAAPSSR